MYDVFMIDPPWPKRKGGLRSARPNQGRDLDYSTMSVGDIFALLDSELLTLAAEQHTVFMWTVEQFLTETDQEMERRGYKRHVRLVWDKENGVAPAFTIRYAHEYLVWYYKPKLTPVATHQRGKFTSVLREKAREHSRKPEAAYSFIDAIYPDLSKIDVFSREKRQGWDQFGDQCDHFSRAA